MIKVEKSSETYHNTNNNWCIINSPIDFLLTDNQGHTITLRLLQSTDSGAVVHKLVNSQRLPRKYWEVSRLKRYGSGLAEARSFLKTVLPLMKAIAITSPILWVCSKRDAQLYVRWFPRLGCKATIIAGSLVGDKPLSYWSETTGGSDDEQVLLLE